MKLTREQRAALFEGKHPRLAFPGSKPCPVRPGDHHVLSSGFWVEVTSIRRSKKGEHIARYTIFDHRKRRRLLRRIPPIHIEDSQMVQGLGLDQAAAEESAYTVSPSQAVASAGEAVDRATQQRFVKEARERFVRVRQEARLRGVETSSQERAVEHRLAELEKLVHDDRAA